MSDVALYAAAELGLLRPSVYYQVHFVHRAVLDDLPVLRAVESEVRRKVADLAGLDPALVAIVHLSPDYLADVLRRRRHKIDPAAPDPHPAFENVAAVFGVIPARAEQPAPRPRLTVVATPKEAP